MKHFDNVKATVLHAHRDQFRPLLIILAVEASPAVAFLKEALTMRLKKIAIVFYALTLDD